MIKKTNKNEIIRIISARKANQKKWEKFDDYEMKDEYDFSGEVTSKKKAPYQTLINTLLRKE